MVGAFKRLALTIGLALAVQNASAMPTPAMCSAPKEIQASAITLVGEIHGTNEVPAWIGSVACGLASLGPVVVALEIPRSEQQRIERYMASPGTSNDRAQLLSGPFWKGQDGRASEAMVALIERLRVLSANGATIRLSALDEWHGPSSRDAAMASELRRLHGSLPGARILALMGNLHARSTPRNPSKGPDDQPVGHLLQDLRPLTVIADYQGGVAWACAPKCGPLTLSSPWGAGREPGFYPGQSPRPGYQAAMNLGAVTLSPPVWRRSP